MKCKASYLHSVSPEFKQKSRKMHGMIGGLKMSLASEEMDECEELLEKEDRHID